MQVTRDCFALDPCSFWLVIRYRDPGQNIHHHFALMNASGYESKEYDKICSVLSVVYSTRRVYYCSSYQSSGFSVLWVNMSSAASERFIAPLLISTAPNKRDFRIKKKKKTFFLFLAKNICCGYSLEAPRWGASNGHHSICFRGEIRKISTLFGCKSNFSWAMNHSSGFTVFVGKYYCTLGSVIAINPWDFISFNQHYLISGATMFMGNKA